MRLVLELALGAVAWCMVGGAVVGLMNAFGGERRARSMRDTGFIADVLLWPIYAALWFGWGCMKVAETAAAISEAQVHRMADMSRSALPSSQPVEGAYEPSKNGELVSLRTEG
jgi:hypothetical protein